ncbi:LysR family transcriptional regulator [Methylotenera mobilis]|uniref:Transcriptional regulator, LysR family n=1 Tax=Methylotenera mobilis (strain JLW8 / ATCC BAA-1282 / DSM 17540) TaxID=583345 RepID=C6WUP2_METML|nr:LysR family transcriptional regulator [Methylotenera mobilis]ACT47641.1 transcriptional regulator, LysR family [Methylotenera mobilis JLW8]
MSTKLSLESLEVLDAIARKGSFAAAAESLFRVPSAITYTVRKLEEDLNVQLFNRSGHRAELTLAGAELLKEGRNLLNAANELESRVKRVAKGVETELTIAVNDLFDITRIYPILDKFYNQNFGTRIKLTQEVFGGGWDALISGRADITLGCPGDTPPVSGFTTKPIGLVEFSYAVAPHHPLAKIADPLQDEDIIRHRAISSADSSRNLPPRTAGILSGQDVLTLPNMHFKLQAQLAGLGAGYMPTKIAEHYASKGQLIIKQVAKPKHEVMGLLAWRNDGGKAQQWFIKQFQLLDINDILLSPAQ